MTEKIKAEAEAAIRVENVCYGYSAARQILNSVSFEIPRGQTIGIIGPSGCGKTTLCNCLCGIIPHIYKGRLSGRVTVDGLDVRETKLHELSKHIGIVFQDADNQIVTTAVEDEIAFAPENMCIEPKRIREIVDDILELLGISHLRLKNPSLLSGGQKQLVAIGSVLALDPDVLLFDEPMSHLDSESVQRVKEVIMRLHQMGKTIIIVEHDYSNIDFADRWLLMTDGRIAADGDPRTLLERGAVNAIGY